MILFIFFINLILISFYIYRRYKKGGFFDLGLLFAIFFFLYNGITSLGYYVTSEFSPQYLPYPQSLFSNFYNGRSFPLPAFLGLLASFGLFLWEIISPFNQKELKINEIHAKYFNFDRLFWVSFVFFLTGFSFYLINYVRLGGFLSVVKTYRMLIYQQLMNMRGSLPYTIFLFPGIAGLTLSGKYLKKRLFISVLLTLIWVSLVSLTGDRRYILYTLIIFGYIILFDKGKDRKFTMVFTLGLILGYFFFAYFEKIRILIPYVVSGKYSLSWAFEWVKKFFFTPWFSPANNELGGPYLTLLYYAKYVPELLFGFTYFYSLIYFLPRSFLPFDKNAIPTLAQQFGDLIHKNYFFNSTIIKGWGFNPVADSYVNFGTFGPFIVFFFIAFIIDYVQGRLISDFKPGRLIFLSNLAIFTLLFNRTGFTEVFQEFVFLMLGCLLLVYIIMLPVKGTYESTSYN